jgi:hypothetical protein
MEQDYEPVTLLAGIELVRTIYNGDMLSKAVVEAFNGYERPSLPRESFR